MTMPNQNAVVTKLQSQTLNTKAEVVGLASDWGHIEALTNNGTQILLTNASIIAKRSQILSENKLLTVCQSAFLQTTEMRQMCSEQR